MEEELMDLMNSEEENALTCTLGLSRLQTPAHHADNEEQGLRGFLI